MVSASVKMELQAAIKVSDVRTDVNRLTSYTGTLSFGNRSSVGQYRGESNDDCKRESHDCRLE